MKRTILIAAVVQLSVFATCSALTCYETDSEGEVHERTNDNWLFCATVPTHYYGNKFIQGRAFGVPIDEDTESFMGMFAATTRRYAKYKFDSISPKMKMVPSFLFRCVCNYDRCNRETEFNAYLSSFTANGEPYVMTRPATQNKL